MKRALVVLACVAAAFTGVNVSVAAAAEEPLVDVSNGMRWTIPSLLDAPDEDRAWCTFAAVGTDSLGNLVALTAGHCNHSYPETDIVLKDYPEAGVIGKATTTKNEEVGKDYLVIKLDETKVAPKSQGPLARIDHIGNNPRSWWDIVCKHGASSGTTCGITITNNTSTGVIRAPMWAEAGDSGSGWTVGPDHTGLVAITKSTIYGYTEGSNIRTVLAHIDAKGAVPGAGFVVTNN